MLPVLIGLIAAMLFGIASFMVYGLNGLLEYKWIEMTFWVLIGTGSLISAISSLELHCLLCKFFQRFKALKSLCRSLPCGTHTHA